jgi:hypothetical protein
MKTEDPPTTDPTPAKVHPWANDQGDISARVAAARVPQQLMDLGISAKAAIACAHHIVADLEEQGLC